MTFMNVSTTLNKKINQENEKKKLGGITLKLVAQSDFDRNEWEKERRDAPLTHSICKLFAEPVATKISG